MSSKWAQIWYDYTKNTQEHTCYFSDIFGKRYQRSNDTVHLADTVHLTVHLAELILTQFVAMSPLISSTHIGRTISGSTVLKKKHSNTMT